MKTRPDDYPKLKDYKPSRFMLPDSHYDKKKADRAVKFIEMLPHTKGEWEGRPFWLLPWQEQIIRDLFGIVKADGFRQFRTRNKGSQNWLRRLRCTCFMLIMSRVQKYSRQRQTGSRLLSYLMSRNEWWR